MKELSVEEKAKLYDEAKARMSRAYNDNRCTIGFMNEIFPELKESEDERVRNKLIEFFKGYSPDEEWWGNITQEDILAWLKKQGEQKTVDEIAKEVCKNKESAVAFFKSAGIINEKGELAEQYRQSEQNTTDKVEPKFKVGQTIKKEGFNIGFTIVKVNDGFYYNNVGDHFPFTDQDNWELVEQNPAEEYNITGIGSKNAQGKLGKMIKNLKPINGVLEQKPWSEEDEDYYDAIIAKLEVTQDDALLTDNQMKFLKSLKDKIQSQPQWKPSDEQMEGIECTIKTLRYQLNAGDNRLDSLYNDLKKLREK